MQPRITNPAMNVPAARETLEAPGKTAASGQAVPPLAIANLIRILASQINVCTVCPDMRIRAARKAGETAERHATLPVTGEWTAQWTS